MFNMTTRQCFCLLSIITIVTLNVASCALYIPHVGLIKLNNNAGASTRLYFIPTFSVLKGCVGKFLHSPLPVKLCVSVPGFSMPLPVSFKLNMYAPFKFRSIRRHPEILWTAPLQVTPPIMKQPIKEWSSEPLPLDSHCRMYCCNVT